MIHNVSAENRIATIQSVATYARKKLNVSNNRDLMYILENSGIYILEKIWEQQLMLTALVQKMVDYILF